VLHGDASREAFDPIALCAENRDCLLIWPVTHSLREDSLFQKRMAEARTGRVEIHEAHLALAGGGLRRPVVQKAL
jgi:hypothetical protein